MMPASLVQGKAISALVLSRLHRASPLAQVLDVGPGLGSYKRLFGPLLPGVPWYAVEVWGPYVARYGLDALYDDVFVSDVRCFDFQLLPRGGAAIFGDVIEHMPARLVAEVVQRALARLHYGILSIPIGHWPQDAYQGNPWERHVDDWSMSMARELLGDTLVGTYEHRYSSNRSMGVFFAAGTSGRRRVLRATLAEAANVVRRTPSLATCGLPQCPDFLERSHVERFLATVAPFCVQRPGPSRQARKRGPSGGRSRKRS